MEPSLIEGFTLVIILNLTLACDDPIHQDDPVCGQGGGAKRKRNARRGRRRH